MLVPAEYLRFDRTPARADDADVIEVATLQAYVGTDHPFGAVDWSTAGAFGRIGISTAISSLEVVDLTSDMKDAAAPLG